MYRQGCGAARWTLMAARAEATVLELAEVVDGGNLQETKLYWHKAACCRSLRSHDHRRSTAGTKGYGSWGD
ncbi:hypothetical protein GOP47_0022977 [Adiantum capillus-veneris]|uniref:Uncharacterized protein n=1 Tax=Adiantum capillus-veneris TaxID=13818 RepID=A0A9D4Z4T7_ADICA|nr:hypothetical protein GOP47_0022977 [Adiantum capillus-veneris]